MANTIDTSLLYSSLAESKKNEPSKSLGKDAFLKLLLAQLQNQDPLNPMEDTEFISQMATFTSLEQMMSLNETVQSLVPIATENKLIGYSQLIGKKVSWTTIDYVTDGSSTQPVLNKGTGTIVAIQYSEKGPILRLEDGTELTPENISEVETSQKESIVSASYLIGKRVKWLVDGTEQSGIVQSVSMKDGKISFYVKDNPNRIHQDQIVSVEDVSLP